MGRISSTWSSSTTDGAPLSARLSPRFCAASALNACPVYRHVGGHAYGSIYPGPIGKVITPSLFGLEEWHELPDVSSLCGACTEACPVRIDIPKLLVELRRQTTEHTPRTMRIGLSAFAWASTRPRVFRLATRTAAVFGRLWGRNGWLRRIPWVLRSWTKDRELPAPAPQTFSDWWRNREA